MRSRAERPAREGWRASEFALRLSYVRQEPLGGAPRCSDRTAWFLQGPSERWQRLRRWAELTRQDTAAGCPGADGDVDHGADLGGERLARWLDFKDGTRRISG